MLATIGYERAELRDFIATLETLGVEVLVDIRERAQSRRPGFSKSTLSRALADAGISYLHFRELGDPKEGRDAARAGNTALFRQVFGRVMQSHAGERALSELEVLAADQKICLMCYERDYRECHRKIVSDHLELKLQKKVSHIGVQEGAGRSANARRVHYTNQSSTSSIQ